MVWLDTFGQAQPEGAGSGNPAESGQPGGKARGKDAPVRDVSSAGPCQRGQGDQQPYGTGERGLDEQRVVGSPDAMLSTKDGGVGRQRGEQSQGHGGRNLPKGHGVSF